MSVLKSSHCGAATSEIQALKEPPAFYLPVDQQFDSLPGWIFVGNLNTHLGLLAEFWKNLLGNSIASSEKAYFFHML